MREREIETTERTHPSLYTSELSAHPLFCHYTPHTLYYTNLLYINISLSSYHPLFDLLAPTLSFYFFPSLTTTPHPSFYLSSFIPLRVLIFTNTFDPPIHFISLLLCSPQHIYIYVYIKGRISTRLFIFSLSLFLIFLPLFLVPLYTPR